jgi:hypothetical protein
MARKAIYNYIFSPSTKQVIIPDPYKLGDILMITNVTRNTVIYNFGDPNRGGTLAYTNASSLATSPAGTALSAGTSVFSNLSNGFTTITLTFDTTAGGTMQPGDQLQIYVESSELKVRPYDFGIDAVERMKVAAPQSLIDADFEYGMQPTKWVQFATMNDVPMVFEQPGTDVALGIPAYATIIGGAATTGANTSIVSAGQTTFYTHNQGTDAPVTTGAVMAANAAPAQNGPRGFIGEYGMIIAQGQAGQANCAAGTTNITSTLPISPQYGGVYQRTFTVANTAGWSPGDILAVVEMPGEGLNAISTAAAGLPSNNVVLPVGSNVAAVTLSGQITSAGNIALTANVSTLGANALIAVETTQFGTWEVMQVNSAYTGRTEGANFNVLRNIWGTNSGNAAIPAGAKIRVLAGNVTTTAPGFTANANLEIMRLDSIDSATQFTVTRSWFNVNASPTFGANSIVFKVNHTANAIAGASASDATNVEIVRTTVISTAYGGGLRTVERGRLGTTPMMNAGPGSLYVQLTGMSYVGNTSQPRVLAFAPAHGINISTNANVGTAYVSTVGLSQAITVSNVEGVFNNTLNSQTAAGETIGNYLSFFPKVGGNQLVGSPVTINDNQTIIRRGGIYSGANIVVANVVSNIGTPAQITVGTTYPHGLLPGHVVQVQLINVNGIVEAGTGQFVIQSTPTSSSFTYVTRPNLVIQSSGIYNLTANVTLFPTGLVKHRYIDGGNNIGTNTPSHGYEMTRQTKKYFRYQSGKGIMFTSGTAFNPVFTPANIVAAGTTVGSVITITVENEHGLQPGANVSLYGINTSGYNAFYTVQTITNNNQFTVLATTTLGATVANWTNTSSGATRYQTTSAPRMVVQNWHGSKIRSGIMDDANGVFYEYDGQTFWAVKRTSTQDLAGRVNVGVGSNLVNGDANTRFLDQLNTGDQVVIRGMTHSIVQVVSQTQMIIQPVYRGTVNAQDARYTKINEERTPQRAFNMDRADGTGPSGYVMNLTKMQMVGIQYTWYGAGFVDYMMRAIDGKMIILHRSVGNNKNDEAYMRTGNLPARYQAVNKGARSWLSKAVNTTATEIQLYDVSEFPTANATLPVTLQIDNEFVRYTAGPFAANGNIAGLTRGASMSSYILTGQRNLYAGSNAGTTWTAQAFAGLGASNVLWASQAFNPATNTWVAVGGFAVAGNTNTAITAYSKDGHTWIQGGNLPSSTSWSSVAYGQVGTTNYMVATSSTAGTACAFSTDDGLTWTSAPLSQSLNGASITFGADANNVPTFVAVGGMSGTSTNLTCRVQPTQASFGSWANGGNTTASQCWFDVTFGKTQAVGTTARLGNYFVVVGHGAAVNTATTVGNYSVDGGTTWIAFTLPSSSTWASAAFGAGIWMAVAGGFGGTAATAAAFQYGNPATAWQAMTMPSSNRWRSIAWGPIAQGGGPLGHWMAVSEDGNTIGAYVSNMTALGGGAVGTSSTIPTWAAAGSPALPFTAVWTNICWGQGFFHCVNATPAQVWQSAISTDGLNFRALQLPVAAAGSPVGNAAAYGAGNIVALTYNGTGVTWSPNGGRHWFGTGQAGALSGTANWTAVAYGDKIGRAGQGRFVAIAAGSTTVNWQDADNLGANWLSGTVMPSSATWQSLCYVNGAFVAVANTAGGTNSSTYSSTGGTTWQASVNLPASQLWTSVDGGYNATAYTTTANAHTIVAVGMGISGATTQVAAYSNVRVAGSGETNGGNVALSLWGQSTLPVAAVWTSVAYGLFNNVGTYVAVSGANSGSGATAYSVDGGRTWTAGGTLPAGLVAANMNNKVVYGGNGVFVVVGNVERARNNAAAYSIDGGVTWVASTLPLSTTWNNVIYTPAHNQFVALSGDPANTTSNVAISLPTGGVATVHSANTGVRVVSVTASPDLNHWGSAIIMDGGFTVDRTYTFTYNVANYAATGLPNGTATAGLTGAPNTVFLMRLAPTISSSVTGELGVKDLVNRAQVLLSNMYINIASTGARYLLQGILNPTNVASVNWRPLNTGATFLQPSFTQFAANNIGVFGSGTQAPNITYTSGNAATGGEQLFSIPISQGTAGFLDLSQIKEITGMVLPGTGPYPNGNEVLAINLVPASSVGNASGTPVASNVDIQITFIESQA